MKINKKMYQTFIVGIGLIFTTTTAFGGFFGGGKDENALSATPFDYSLASSGSVEMAKEYFNDYENGSLKGLKKVVIPNFQVRFCMYDDAKKTYFSQSSAGGLSFTSSGNIEAGVEIKLPNDVREKITKRIYDQFVERLQKEGIEVIDINKFASMPEVQKGIVEVPESGTVEELTTLSQRQTEEERKKRASWFYPWAIHYPSKFNNLLFSGISQGNVPGQSVMRVVERSNLHPGTIKAAKKIGAGIASVGFEVRLEKMDARMESSLWDKKMIVEAAPVLRTRLLAFKIMPDDGDETMLQVGPSGGNNFVGMNFDGYEIMPIPKPMLFGTPKHGVYPWIETPATYGGLTKAQDYLFHLTPDPVALQKDIDTAINAQFNLIFAMFHEAKAKK